MPIIRTHRSTTYVDAAYCYKRSLSVGRPKTAINDVRLAPTPKPEVHRESKKGATLTMAITLSIFDDGFAKFFH